MPSFSTDALNKNEGLDNFYGKIVIFNESHNKINKLSMKNNMDIFSYNFGFEIWKYYWPQNVTQGIIPKWLRVMYIDSFKTHFYPSSLCRNAYK